MYNNYKLRNGKILSIFTWPFFKSSFLNKDKYVVKKLEGREIDLNGRDVTDLFHVNLLKDNKGFYFMYDAEKVYLNNYIYLSIKELINKIHYGNFIIDDFISTLKKESKNIVIIEKIPEFSGDKLYDENIHMKEVACELVDDKYKECLWYHYIETVPIDEEDRKIYGKNRYYVSDLYFLIKNGYFKMFDKKEYLNSLNECKKRVFKK